MARQINQGDQEVAQNLLQARRAEADILAALVYRGIDRASAAHVLRSLKEGKSPETSAPPSGARAFRPLRVILARKLAGTAGGVPRMRAATGRTRNLVVAAAFAVVVLLLLVHPWPHFQLARLLDSEAAYTGFVERHPASKWTRAAEERMRKLREEPLWSAALNSGKVWPLRQYLKTYPDGKHVAEAHATVQRLAQARWLTVSLSSSENEIRAFIRDFPDSALMADAGRRLQEVLEEQAWWEVRNSGELARLQEFIQENPASRFLKDAQSELDRLCQEKWRTMASSESEEGLRAFSREFAGTPLEELAERRIAGLYYDLNWLAQKNSIAAYQRHLQLYPTSPYRAAVEKRIIDLEVADILASNPGVLPPATLLGPARASGSLAELNIKNRTGYELTVRYSGVDSRRIVLPVNGSQTLHLRPGTYTVAASVSGAVRSYAGTDSLQSAQYDSVFYVRSEFEIPDSQRKMHPIPSLKLDDLLPRRQ